MSKTTSALRSTVKSTTDVGWSALAIITFVWSCFVLADLVVESVDNVRDRRSERKLRKTA